MSVSAVTKWDSGISNKALVFSNNDTNAKRPGNAACYPAAFAQLTSGVCSFTIKIDSLPNKGNWLTFGLAEKGFVADSSDGFGRESKSWGVALECKSSGTSSATMHSGSKTSIASLPRRLKEGDMLSGLVDLDSGRFTFSLNGAEFSHQFSVPKATDRSKYVWGMTFATDLVVTILPTVPTITAAPAASSANMSVQRSKVWAVDMSNSHLTYTDSNATAQRVGSVSCYPVAVSALQGPAAVFSVRIDCLSGKSNWLTFGLAKKGIAKDSSDGMGRTKDSWGIADDRSSSSSSATYHACGTKTLGSLSRKLREGDVLTSEANTSAGWCEVRLNETEFKHRFSIPAGAHEGYVFGVSFSNDAKVCILPTASGSAPTLAAAVVPAVNPSGAVWDKGLSNKQLTFSNGDTSARRVGSVSSYPAAFVPLSAAHAILQMKVTAAPIGNNWLTFGLVKAGFKASSSDGVGKNADSWGIVDERSSSGKNATMRGCGSTMETLARKLQEGDVLTAEADVAAGWCEVRLNQTECTHRFTIPVGSKESYLFGATFSNDTECTILSCSAVATVSKAASSVAAESVQRSTVWAVDLSNSHLTYTDNNATAQRVGSVSCYPVAVSTLQGPAAVFSVRIDCLSGKSNWLTFGLAKKGIAKDSSDGMGRTKDSWGIADDRSSSSSSATYHACGTKALGSLPRSLKEGDVLTAEANTSAGWCEVRLNETEFKHRFSIPAGAHEGYVFGVSFSNDAKMCILPTASGSAPTPAAAVVPAVNPSGAVWDKGLSNKQLTFSNGDTSARRVGSVSSYPAAFVPLSAAHAILQVKITAAPIGSNWLTFGLVKAGFKASSSDGVGKNANSWGIVDERNGSGKNATMQGCGKVEETLARKLQEGDVLTTEADVAAGWCEVRLNQTECTHRFTIPVGSKESYLFGATFSNNTECTIIPTESSDAREASKDALLARALEQGGKAWKRSKFSLLGQGRAGKTAFANAVAGRSFEETASTVGINQLTCDVKHIKTGAGGAGEGQQVWGECAKHSREYEAALAEILVRQKRAAAAEKEGGTKEVALKGADIRAYMQEVTATSTTSAPAQEYQAESSAPVVEASVSVVAVEEAPSTTTVAAPVSPKKAPTPAVEESAPSPQRAPSVPITDPEPTTAPTPAAGPHALDEEMVMKMLATMEDADTGLLISLFDFGGQSVFDVIHHLFLTRNGVYALVFNMEWLVKEGPEKDKALRFMRNWLSSIAVHTYNKTTRMTAPIVIVGTRLDTITKPADHEKISTILHQQFSDNLAWRSVVGNEDGRDSNGKAFQWFYPVDNKMGKQGAAMKHLMSVVHGVIDKAEYTHKEVPLTWFRVIDQMGDTKRDCLSLQEVTSMGDTCGVSALEVPFLLAFLHDMGHLMWLDEPGLRDVVILDPVSYLVAPATIIICKLTPDHDDTTHHFMPSHRECERMHKREWTLLKNDGVLNTKLLPILWSEYIPHTENLLQLMVKFGLLVPLRTGASAAITQYLVPTLLSPAPANDPFVANWTDDQQTSSCYFAFTLADELGQSSTVADADLRSAGFLPGGMFERIVGKALSWSQDTARGSSISLQSVLLHKDMAVLAFGGQRFRLVHCTDIHCVRVDIEGRHPVGIQQKLHDFIRRICDECMRSLQCFTAIAFSSNAEFSARNLTSLQKNLLPSELLIPLEQLRKASKGESMLAWRGGRTLINQADIKTKFGPWLQLYDLRDRYDVFISYRWGKYDSEFTEQLFDMFSNYSVSSSSRAVEVFLDRKRLQEGRLFKSDFAAALTHSLIALPIVSTDALKRMTEHSSSMVDNVLLEWIMILESFSAGKLLKVYPILFGGRSVVQVTGEVRVRDFFSEGIKDHLPHIAPDATLLQAADLLRSNGIEPSSKMQEYTVHSIVHDLMQFLLCKASDYTHSALVEAFAEKVTYLLSGCDAAALDAVTEAVADLNVSTTLVAPSAVSPTIPATPHTPAAAAGTTGPRPLKALTTEEVGRLLAAADFEKLVELFRANKVTGKRLYFCEEYAELMGEEFGVTSKPVARELMEQIEEWKTNGVVL